MNILQKIFKEHYEEMIYLQHPRDSVIENIDRNFWIWITFFTNLMISMMTILAKKVFISFKPQPSF